MPSETNFIGGEAQGSGMAVWLEHFVREHLGVSATVYRPVGSDELELVAAFNVAEQMRAQIARIPRGEGVPGLAFERNAAISTCAYTVRNERRSTPRFKFIDAEAMVAIPVHDRRGEIRAVLTLIFPDGKVLDDHELVALDGAAAGLPI